MVRRVTLAIALLAACGSHAFAAGHTTDGKLDDVLRQRAHAPRGTSRVIIQTSDGAALDGQITALSGTPGRRLRLLGAQVAEVPDSALDSLAGLPRVRAIGLDRPVHGLLERTAASTGARWVRENLGFDGSGVGVAIIDSGLAAVHDDLDPGRVVHFADFVNDQSGPYDDYGHGTHVAGIIAGTGYASNGTRRGMAPGANLVVLKVLDRAGHGYISSVIAALDYAVATRAAYNVRVVNVSVAAGVYESYNTDPLTLAARRAVESGLVVVAAAGNLGRNAAGKTQYGGITAPGNAPWVLTVGASSHMGTPDREGDAIAPFSWRGPSYIDYSAKPDIVAPGVGIESLTDASTLLYETRPSARLWGAIPTVSEPYLRMSGTSMAAPVVAGTVALMLQANPALTPNAVKAILHYTAEAHRGVDHLTQGAGSLNARGAVALASRFLARQAASTAGAAYQGEAAPGGSDPVRWSRHIIWGNHRLSGGVIRPDANAWGLDVVWGAARTSAGASIQWGALCDPALDPECDTIIRGTWCDAVADPSCENFVQGAAAGDENIVWGTDCGGRNCENIAWGASACDPNTNPECDSFLPVTGCDPAVEPDCEHVVPGGSVPGGPEAIGRTVPGRLGRSVMRIATPAPQRIHTKAVWGQ